jgi:hypothetical protein
MEVLAMGRRFIGVHVQFEPADRSVGLMGESFHAWPVFSDGKDEGPWCELVDCATGEVRWEDSETAETIEPPFYAPLVEATLRSFVTAFYAQDADAPDYEPSDEDDGHYTEDHAS